MRMMSAAVSFFVLAACGQPPAETPAPEPTALSVPSSLPETPATAPAPVEGWETGAAAHITTGIGTTIPEFSGARANGDSVTRETLRDRWTILGFDSEATVTSEETIYIGALNSAVNQDPDLDFIQVYRLSEDAIRAPVMNWPALIDVGPITDAFGVSQTPVYLLVGPDLTIEAWRGPLSATPEDGVKPVFRGISEIRKQVAAPQ